MFRLLFLLCAASAFLFSDFTRSPYLTTSGGVDTVKYVPTSIGSPRIEGYKPISPPKTEATLEYDVLFDKNFEWTYGGKLPGFKGGARSIVTTGCVNPQPTNAWSYRLMWKRQGKLMMYMYDQERTTLGTPCGITRISRADLLQKGVWNRLKLYMKVNSAPGAKDGIARLYVNGSLLLERTGIPWRGNGSGTLINYVLFSTFYGGKDPTWAPSKPTYAKFRNVTLY